MQVSNVYIADVVVGDRLRKFDPEKAAVVADSMKSIGLQQPISVWDDNGTTRLIAGRTRLAAATQLGWNAIPALYVDLDDIDRQIWEIDENLARAELGPAETALHMRRRRELWSLRDNTVQNLNDITKPGRPRGFHSETADKTGQSKTAVWNAVNRGDKIAPDVLEDVAGTDMDKGTVLDELARMPHEEQRRAASVKSLPKQEDEDKKRLSALKAAWNKASPTVRTVFVSWLEERGVQVFGIGAA